MSVYRKFVRHCDVSGVDLLVYLSMFLLLMGVYVVRAKCVLEASAFLRVKRMTIRSVVLLYMELGVSGLASLAVQGAAVVVYTIRNDFVIVQGKRV